MTPVLPNAETFARFLYRLPWLVALGGAALSGHLWPLLFAPGSFVLDCMRTKADMEKTRADAQKARAEARVLNADAEGRELDNQKKRNALERPKAGPRGS